MIEDDEIQPEPYPDADRIAALLAFATAIGATHAARLAPEAVQIENRLAAYCRSPKCPHYGQSMSCPPHVSGPPGLRKLLNNSLHAIVLRLEIDSDSLNGEQRPEVMRLLHEITAMVEIEAKRLGFQQAQAFAGGSCKASFCSNQSQCQVLSAKGTCRFPDSARPSMSGFGVNVGKLMVAANWPTSLFSPIDSKENTRLSWVAGLVLLG